MGVREEDGIKALKANAKGLLAEVRRRVNDDVLAIAREKQGRRRRLSRGSCEVQTRQWQPSDGTPIDVPEPRSVSFRGFDGI